MFCSGKEGVDREAVGGVDDLLLAQIEHDEVAVHRRAAPDLLLGTCRVLPVELHALAHVRRLEDLVHRHPHAVVDELHHQLVVGDAEVAEAPEARARVHEEAHEDPALGVEDVVGAEGRRVRLVHRGHHLRADVGEALGAAEVVVDHACGGVGVRVDHAVGRDVGHAQHLAVVVVEGEVCPRHVREVGGHVARTDLDLAVLDVLGVDELDLVEHAQLLEERGADEPVEVAARHEPVLAACGRLWGVSGHGSGIVRRAPVL